MANMPPEAEHTPGRRHIPAGRPAGPALGCAQVEGFPAPNATIRSRGTMVFALRNGTIRARVRVTQRFRSDGRHARQTTTGTIVGGYGRYRGARGTVTGKGTVVDTAARLADVRVAYRLLMQ